MSKIILVKNYLVVLYKKYWWLMPMTIFFVWRIVLEIVGRYYYLQNLLELVPKAFSQNIWWHWDSNWYNSIVYRGYYIRPGMQSNVPFFPLYPMLWKAVMLVTGWPTYVCALFVSNILALGGFVVFYRWLSVVWGEGIAKRGLLALAVFPTSFFLISAYSDSTLLILLASAMLLAERGRWKTAALVALLASAARPVGIFLGPVLIWLWWNKNKNNKIKNWFDVLSLLFLSPLGLFFFSAYLWHQVGDPLAWLHGQVYYSRSFESPLRLLYSYAVCIIRLGPTWVLNVEELSALLLTVVCLPRLYKIRPVFAFWAVLNLLPSLFSGRLTSLDRYVLLIIPIFIVVAMQKKWIYFSYLFVSTVMMITYVSRFVIGYWAG